MASDRTTRRQRIPDELRRVGGLGPGVAREVANRVGVPEAEVTGVGSFFHLLADPDIKIRVCTGLSCQLAGADGLLDRARASGLPAAGCSCLAACDQAPAVLKERRVLGRVEDNDIDRAGGNWQRLESRTLPVDDWPVHIGPEPRDPERLAVDLLGDRDESRSGWKRARELGADGVLDVLRASGLQGRGGAGFPAFRKWEALLSQSEAERYVVLNADEGEPATFKDREILVRRPELVLEGLAIAANTIGASEVYLYLRGEFPAPRRALVEALARAGAANAFDPIRFHVHEGHGAYICGEETALLEALEGKRGMPRLRPPYPTERGLWGRPTLIHNVETIAMVPAIVKRGGDWFRQLGRDEPGSKLYSVSGHVARPGVYELPLGVTLDELIAAAGGMIGQLKAFVPGGASSGFLPASERSRPLSFGALEQAGSMLGSAGVVVLNDSVDIPTAVATQLRFFEEESCGQCAPCRIGTYYLRESLDRHLANRRSDPEVTESAGDESLHHVADAAWQMNEGSICGLGQAAPLPLTSALRHFPEEFRR